MKKSHWFHTGAAACALAILCLAAAPSHGAVTADPAKTTFTSPQQSATIKLMKDGTPVAAKDIRGWRFLASGHDYRHMLDVEKVDGAIKIAPSKTLEVGSYDLAIDTAQGAVTVQVFAPLSDLPDIVEKRAALTGESEKRIAEKMGLSTPAARSEIQIDLPPVYYEGQTLTLSMPRKAGRSCAWFMNGDPVAAEPERNAIAYTFKDSGEYVLTYIETEQQEGRTIAASHAKAHTRVVPIPAIPTDLAVGTEMTFEPPTGYRKHVWRVDGQETSTAPALKRRVPG